MNTWRKLVAVVVVGWAALWASGAAWAAAISINLASDVEFASGGGSVGDVLVPFAVCIGLGVVFFLIGVYKFRRRFA